MSTEKTAQPRTYPRCIGHRKTCGVATLKLVRRQANRHQQVTVVAVILSQRLVLTGNHGGLRRIGEGETNELCTENLQTVREVSGVVRNGDVITGQVRLQSLGCLLYTSDAADE